MRTSYVRQGDEARQPYDIIDHNDERPYDCPEDWIIFGSYSWDGSRLYFDCSSETSKVIRCERSSIKVLAERPDFWNWLLSESIRLTDLFDDEGKMKDPSIPTV